MLRVLYYTTTDSEYLSLIRARDELQQRFPDAFHIDFFGKNSERDMREIYSCLDEADFVLITLMGTFIGMDDFDDFLEEVHRRKIPVHIQSSVMRESKELRKKASQEEAFQMQVEQYIYNGGSQNYLQLLLFLSNRLKGSSYDVESVQEIPLESLYYRGELFSSLEVLYKKYPRKPLQAALVFYRSLYLSKNMQVIDALIEEGVRAGIQIIGCFFYSVTPSDLDNKSFCETFLDLFGRDGKEVQVILNLAGFSINTGTSKMGEETLTDLKEIDLPILKIFSSTGTYDSWIESDQGLTPIDYSLSLVMPEFDGQIMGQLVSHKEKTHQESLEIPFHSPLVEGIQGAVAMAKSYARLRRTPASQKRLAIILHNYPAGDANIGSASGLDTFTSVFRLLHRLQEEGYHLEKPYQSAEELLEDVLSHGTNEREWVDREKKRSQSLFLSHQDYLSVFASFSPIAQKKIVEEWGNPPGDILTDEIGILIPGFSNGNIFIGMQPSRGFGDDPGKIAHSPDLVAHHQYIAYYHYLKNIWKADAYLHVGTHGTLEFLPGKSTGLSRDCYPNKLLSNVPNFYYYIIKNPAEGTIAKRRSNAAIISYLIAQLSFVHNYDELEVLESTIQQYERAQYESLESSAVYWEEVQTLIQEMHLHDDLDLELDASPEDVLSAVWKYLYEIRSNYITKGLHILGDAPREQSLIEMLLVLLRTENEEIPSLVRTYAQALGYDLDQLLDSPEERTYGPQRNGELIQGLYHQLAELLEKMRQNNWQEKPCQDILLQENLEHPDLFKIFRYIRETLVPKLEECSREIDAFLEGLEGKFILPGKSGNISRGGADLLPTGRNFYTLDPLTVPSKSAWKTGRALGDAVLADYYSQHQRYPESIAIILWGLSTLRSRGDCLAQIYYLLGLEPMWEPGTGRVRELRVIPLEELGRPRVDVTVRISGVFRDIFPHQLGLLEKAFSLVASLEEEEDQNFLLRHVREDIREALAGGKTQDQAHHEAMLRVFGSKPGAYGTGVSHAIDESKWESSDDLAEIFLNLGSYAYTSQQCGIFHRESFEKRLQKVEATVQNATSRETDILHVDDYYQYHGGLASAVKFVRGEKPVMYCGDSSDPERIKLREADKELKFVYRSRVLNPEWIASMTEHGYKAAGDFSKMFKYALGWDATAEIMDKWMYDALAEKYVLDPEMLGFFEKYNPMALKDMIETLLEAEQRGLWEASQEMVESLYELLLRAEALLENTLI